jgi:hypothetical protein
MKQWKSTTDAEERSAAGSTEKGSKAILTASLSDPPLPKRCILAVTSGDATIQITCDGFQFNGKMPAWHHTLDIEKLMKDVPYLDAVEIKYAPQDPEDQAKMTKGLLLGTATLLIRPALRDPAIRKNLEQSGNHLDFKQIELHEKLLRGAWLRALERQQFDPAKGLPPPQ